LKVSEEGSSRGQKAGENKEKKKKTQRFGEEPKETSGDE